MSDTKVIEPAQEADDEFALEQRLYEESLKTLDEGQVLHGLIVAKSNDELLVDIGGKSEGVVTSRELSSGISIADLKIGDTLEVLVHRIDGDGDGTMYLSEKRARALKTWEKVLEAHERNDAINATVTQVVKGGVLVDLGMRGFVPASQIRRHPVGNLDELVGKELRLKVIDLDHKRRRVVLSQRVVLEEELNQKKMELLSTLQAGQIREGTIVRLADFGAFVDLGGIDGLIHNSELSWSRIKHPSEVVQIGDKVMVEVMKFDAEAKKVSLSVKHSLEDPWKTVPDQLVEGTLVPATLIKATQNYLLVELLPGVTGMVPKSEFDAAAPPAQGEAVQVRLLSINVGTRRITASMSKVNGTSSDQAETQAYLEGQDEGSETSGGDAATPADETPVDKPLTIEPPDIE
ncbi:MAG TPA: S1 RNA-binding domain-containing protein [Candidatus Eremiobacteraceae bacterium]|nr:S1 RNA-binding domain-containing protein [Candidatus Eremiobacteraceae bacterium]